MDLCDNLSCAPEEVMRDIKALMEYIVPKEAVGFVLRGSCESDVNHVGWGTGFKLETGEVLQVRAFPRGSMGRPMEEGEVRFLSFRRVSSCDVPLVGVALLLSPTRFAKTEVDACARGPRTISCQSLQVIMPSLFNKHDPLRELPHQLINVDSSGYHSCRPTTLTVTHPIKTEGRTLAISVAPGSSYAVIAAHLCGVDLPDPMVPSTMSLPEESRLQHMDNLERMIRKQVGADDSERHFCAALTVLDVLSAEGVVGLLCHPFLKDALPDCFHSPMGLSFVNIMASRIACHPNQFKLPQGTDNDVHANLEISTSFHSRWLPVADRQLRAIDVALRSGYEEALSGRNASRAVEDNLTFWQRVGQRLNCVLGLEDTGSDRRRGLRAGELCADPVADAKNAAFERQELGIPLTEGPRARIHLSPRADMRTRLNLMQDEVEHWLRFGAGSGDDGEPGEAALNKDALRSASSVVKVALQQGPGIFLQYGCECFLVGEKCSQQCADCGQRVGALEDAVFGSMASVCALCQHRRCRSCASAALRRADPALRCGACSKDRQCASDVRAAKRGSKKTKKKQ
jgi:hypothetical protein